MTVDQHFKKTTISPAVNKLIWHMTAWAAFICYECGMLWYNSIDLGTFLSMMPFYALNIGLFYFNAFVILPLAANSRRPYIFGILLVATEMGIYIVLKWFLDLFENAERADGALLHPTLYGATNLWRGLYFVGISVVYWSFVRILAYREQVSVSEKETLTLQRDLAESRNAYMQQQLNPHTMFNALNFVYNAVYKNSPEAAECVLLIADIQRYALENTGDDGKVPLANELTQLQNLIRINRMRYDHEIFVNFHNSIAPGGHHIIPLLLFTFTENVFKHGVLKDRIHPAVINIDVDESGKLHFNTRNLKQPSHAWKKADSTGLRNAGTRLNYSYAGNFELAIDDGNEFYELNLFMQL